MNGETFSVGASSDLLYINSGSACDWAKADLNIKYSYVLELRPGKNSLENYFGFVMPESKMPLVAPETYAGMKSFFFSII